MKKTLNAANIKYLWKRIKALVAPLATTSQLQAVLSGLQTQLNTKADIESGVCTLKLCSDDGTEIATASGVYKKTGGLVYLQAKCLVDENAVPDVRISYITGFPFTVLATGSATNASDLHYMTNTADPPKTLAVPSDGYVGCTMQMTKAIFIYGTYIP